MEVGIRLNRKDSDVSDLTYIGYGIFLWMLVVEVKMGIVRVVSVRMNDEINRLITFIWSCTNFLVPKTNGILLSYKSKKAIVLSMECGISSSSSLSLG